MFCSLSSESAITLFHPHIWYLYLPWIQIWFQIFTVRFYFSFYSSTLVEWLLWGGSYNLLGGADHIQLYLGCFFWRGIVKYTDFFRSVGTSPVSWIMLRSFGISLISKAVSISDGTSLDPAALPFFHLFEGLLNFLLKNLGAFIIIDDRWWASVIMLQLCDVFWPPVDNVLLFH